ncbi:MAG: hypothetical protein WCR27_04270 [Eubacteriales bacterium]
MRVRINDNTVSDNLILKIRLDFRAEGKNGRFFFGTKTCQAMAELCREEQKNILKNVPLKGVVLLDIDMSMDIYSIQEGERRRKREIAYAPLLLTIQVDSIENIIPLIIRQEFKQIELVKPENYNVSKLELKRLIYVIHNTYYHLNN